MNDGRILCCNEPHSSEMLRKHVNAVRDADFIWMVQEKEGTSYLKNRFGNKDVDQLEFAEIKLSAIPL